MAFNDEVSASAKQLYATSTRPALRQIVTHPQINEANVCDAAKQRWAGVRALQTAMMKALTMIIATLGFNHLKNVLMLGKTREGVGNSVACTGRRVICCGLVHLRQTKSWIQVRGVRFQAKFCVRQRKLLR